MFCPLKENRLFVDVLSMLFALSTAFLTAVLMERLESLVVYWGTVATSFILTFFIVRKFDITGKILSDINLRMAAVVAFAAILQIYSCQDRNPFGRVFSETISGTQDMIGALNSISLIFASFSLFIILYCVIHWLFPIIMSFFKKLDNIDKTYIVALTALAFIITFAVYSVTTIFYGWDYVYSLDIFQESVWYVNFSENDLRQPLYGVFAIPLNVVSYFLSVIIPIPNARRVFTHVLLVVFMALTAILLTKILKLDGPAKIAFLLFYSSSYAFVLFFMASEQYQIAGFWLVLFVYILLKEKDHLIAGVLSVGALVPNGFMILATFERNKRWLMSVVTMMLMFLVMCVVFGQIGVLLYSNPGGDYGGFFSGLSVESLCSYLKLVGSCFIGPDTIFITRDLYGAVAMSENNIHLVAVGGCILALFIIGLVTNRKDRLIQLSAIWALVSLIFVGVMGLGVPENGVVLYSYMFSWAYIVVIFRLYQNVIDKYEIKNKAAWVIPAVFAFIMLAVNVYNIYEIVSYGIDTNIRW